MKGHWIRYSSGEISWIEANAELPASDLHAEFCTTFARHDVTLVNLVALRKRRGWRTGRTGRFSKGHESWNTGRKGSCAPGSEKGWFTKGERRGRAARMYKPIGTERFSRDGYLERKVHDGLPLQSRWCSVHRIEWEAVNGPLPKGMALKCLDGDKANTSPTNWECIPRALLPQLAGGNGRGQPILAYDDAPPELKPGVLALAKLKHAVNRKRSSANEQSNPSTEGDTHASTT